MKNIRQENYSPNELESYIAYSTTIYKYEHAIRVMKLQIPLI